MADEGLKDFTVNWILAGLLLFSLIAFATDFFSSNNANALNDGTGAIFNQSSGGLSNKLIESPEDSNTLLNITSNTNPEVSDLGSRDSVAVGFGSKGTGTSYWETSKTLLSWVFSGTAGTYLLATIGGLVGLLAMFYIWRFIRNGL